MGLLKATSTIKNYSAVFAYLMGNERKGRYVALLCHDSLIFKWLIDQELAAKIELVF
jgi:hypothetical protein